MLLSRCKAARISILQDRESYGTQRGMPDQLSA